MSEMDATHYSFYVDETDESIVINEEKLKASGLPYIRRYRTKSCNSSTASSATPEANRLNGSVDDSLLATGVSARGSGSSADHCIDGFNNLRLCNFDHDKENREPSQPELQAVRENCKQSVSQSESTDACADPEEDILAPYFKPHQCQPAIVKEAIEEQSKQNASEVQLGDEDNSLVRTAPLAMSTPRPSKASAQNLPYRLSGANAETAEVIILPNAATEIQENLCSEDPVRQRLSFGSDGKAEHTFDNELFCSGVKPLPSPSHVETEQKPVAHVPTEIQTCDNSFIVLREPAQEKLQAATAVTSPLSNDNELQSSAVTTVSHFVEHTSKTSDYVSGEHFEQDGSVVASLVTKPECLPMVQSGVEMACQTSFCFGNVPATSAACVTPVKHFAARNSPQKGAGSAPAKPFLNRREGNLAGTVRGRCRTPSNIPFRNWNSPTASTKHRETVFKVPTPISGKTPGRVPVMAPRKSPVKSPLHVDQVQARDGTPRSVGKGARSPWSVVSPVARYIHENPAPPLIQIVRPRKSPSAKTLTTATSPVHSTAPSASPRTVPLPDKRYQTSNMGILHRAGLDRMVKPSKPIVIKHTVSTEADGRSVPEMEASVIQVIHH